jgi:tRNA G18 (ribose-2'-O)-methylase SpoU
VVIAKGCQMPFLSFLWSLCKNFLIKTGLINLIDGRNVSDYYKLLDADEIRKDLERRRRDGTFAVLMENFEGSLTISTVIRSANAFNTEHMYYMGRKKIDTRGCVGCQNYTDISYLSNIDELKKLKEKYTFIGLENNISGCQNLHTFNFPKNPLFIIGSESAGISKPVLALCDHLVKIEQVGSVRSLNAAVAGSIIMYEWSRMS